MEMDLFLAPNIFDGQVALNIPKQQAREEEIQVKVLVE